MQINAINRRKFLTWAGISGAALIIGCNNSKSGKETGKVAVLKSTGPLFNITPFVAIDKTGVVTIFNPRPEMGQGTHQSIPALIAEELEIDLQQVIIRQTGGEPIFGDHQWVGGSESVKGDYFLMRTVGAAAKAMLIQAASELWKVPSAECYAENAKILHRPSGKNLGYGDLVEKASKLNVPEKPALKDPKDFKILGKSARRSDLPLKVSGQAVFGIDIEVPDMVYASIQRCPVFGGKLIDFDASEALKIPGVEKVVKVERVMGKYRTEGVAVVATSYWTAQTARKALKVNWDYMGYDSFNSKDYAQKMRDLSKSEGITEKKSGDFPNAFAKAPVKLEAFYETPVVTHSAMEPINCVALWKAGNQVEIWTSTQVPGDVYKNIPKEFKIPEGNVKVNTTFIGGGFGRRLYLDFIIEAVNISKSIGKPVKVIWTREDDIQNGPFRPMSFSAMKAGLGKEGKAIAFQHKVIAPSLQASDNKEFDWKGLDGWMTEATGTQPYEIAHLRTQYVPSFFHIPIVAWRSVTSSTIAFAHECFIDEMAVKAGKDPLQYRLDMLTKPSDVKRVLLKLREISKWDTALPANWGRGIAQWDFFAGLAGEVVEVSKQANGSIKIEKVYVVIDLGTVVNPDNVKAQMEGAVAMAISAAVKNGITFEKGRTVQSNFHDNPIIRIQEMPEIIVEILAEGGEKIKGVGEPGLPPFAPALGNAIFNATGVRLRSLPINLEKIQ